MSRACHTESVPQIRGGRSYPTPEVLVSRCCQGLVAKHSHMCFQLCHLQIISFARYTLRKQEIYFSLLKIGKEISFFSLRTFTLENLQELSHLFKMPVFEDQRGLFFSWHFFFFSFQFQDSEMSFSEPRTNLLKLQTSGRQLTYQFLWEDRNLISVDTVLHLKNHFLLQR